MKLLHRLGEPPPGANKSLRIERQLHRVAPVTLGMAPATLGMAPATMEWCLPLYSGARHSTRLP